ncbi:proline-rich protein 23A-like [Thomomys bottae]
MGARKPRHWCRRPTRHVALNPSAHPGTDTNEGENERENGCRLTSPCPPPPEGTRGGTESPQNPPSILGPDRKAGTSEEAANQGAPTGLGRSALIGRRGKGRGLACRLDTWVPLYVTCNIIGLESARAVHICAPPGDSVPTARLSHSTTHPAPDMAFDMMGTSTAPWWGPESAGPSPAKRSRLDQPGPPPSLEDPSKGTPAQADAQAGLTSLVVLATGCALQVPLGHVDLVLEPPPTSVLTVDLQGHKLVLIPQDLLGPAPQGQPEASSEGLLLEALLDARPEDVVVQQGLCFEPVPEVARQEEAYAEEDAGDTEDAAQDTQDLHLDFPEPRGSSPQPRDPSPQPGSAVPPTPDPDGRGAQSVFHPGFHLRRSVPGSPLQPLPPSPSPSSNPAGRPNLPVRPARPPRPASKARRRLF